MAATSASGCALAVDWDALRRGEASDADGATKAPPMFGARPDGGAAVVDTGAAADSRAVVDSRAVLDTGAAVDAGTDAGTAGCAPDPTVSCGDPAQLGFSCTGQATPPETSPSLACGAAMAEPGDRTAYCCSGNYCGYEGSSADAPRCVACYLQSCAAVMCQCETDPDVDDAGYPFCDDFIGCVSDCEGPTSASVPPCETRCDGMFTAPEAAEGAAVIGCLLQYCDTQCNWD